MLPEDKKIKSKQELKNFINYEKEIYKTSKLKYILGIGERAILRRIMVFLRKAEYHTNLKHKIRSIFFRLKLSLISNKYSIHIPLNCCARGLNIMHLGPVLINDKCEVGEDCVFHINTALVAGGIVGAAPKLGKHVILGVGAVVLGGVSVADNVAIGANAVVNKDVLESNIAVAGVPAKKISNNGSLEWNKDKENSKI